MLNVLGMTRNELMDMKYPSSKKIENEYRNDKRIDYFINAELP